MSELERLTDRLEEVQAHLAMYARPPLDQFARMPGVPEMLKSLRIEETSLVRQIEAS